MGFQEFHTRGLKNRAIYQVKQAKGIVCTPLDRINKITSVSPEVWNGSCDRQGSWYRTSEKNGLYLIISAFELDDFEARKAAVITESDFVLPRAGLSGGKRASSRGPGNFKKNALPMGTGGGKRKKG
jgi:hypothetical protein